MKTLIAVMLVLVAASAVADGGSRLTAPNNPKWKAEAAVAISPTRRNC
ncbi:MAG: hypothetical protein ACYC2R_15145 [Burkholderiales bacterium]